jgi:pimeloyl-ACP methyl ester carboxylesterase
MDITRGDGVPAPLERPQEPLPPYPYWVEEVVFSNPTAEIELAGTLTVPEGAGPFPAAILVSGSGPQDRDETLMGHKPFKVIADHLTRHGIAVLRYDDRGVGGSTGVFAMATSEDFTDDALEAIRFLEQDSRIRGDAIGIVGHSEGGLVGPMAASRSESVDYVVMLAGPGVTGLEVLVEQGRLINAASGAPPEMTAFNTRLQTRLAEVGVRNPDPEIAAPLMKAVIHEEIEALSGTAREMATAALNDQAVEQTVGQMNSVWFRFFLNYDPRPALESTRVPVLALFGDKDLQVPPEQSAEEVRAAFARGANTDATVTVLPGLNHLFQEADTGSPSEYQSITQTISPVALETLSEWITTRFGPLASDS